MGQSCCSSEMLDPTSPSWVPVELTSLARSAVAHGERRFGLLEKIASGGRSQETGWLSMSGKVGSRLSRRVIVAVWKCRPGSSFGDFPGGSRVGWRSKAEVEVPIVFPVSLVGTELRPTRRAQYWKLRSWLAMHAALYTILAGSVGVAETA